MLKVLSVSELGGYVARVFDAEELLHDIKVYGEISNLSLVRGNLYFNLKDQNSLMPCVMFGANVSNIKEGDQILATGSMHYYSKGGKLNFYVTSMAPYGSGDLYKKFLELKQKLEDEGVFSAKYKKELPRQIKNVGVITSPTGAVLHDIETVSHRRNPLVNIFVYPSKVQGDGAEYTIIKGIEYFNKRDDVDVVIIARGGGSIEDLQAFNTEVLARSIVTSNKPIISAVGHETDYTICDFASSIRAATPSVAAELVSNNVFESYKKLEFYLERINFLLLNLIDSRYEKIDLKVENLGRFYGNLNYKNSVKINKNLNKLRQSAQNYMLFKENMLGLKKQRLDLLNPKFILDAGWAKVFCNETVVKSVDNLKNDDIIKIQFKDGNAVASVSEKIKKGK